MIHVEPVRRRDHVVILHRWQDNYALYEDYIDHLSHHVTYVATALSHSSVPPSAGAVVTVAEITNLEEVKASLARPVQSFGRPIAVVALQEGDLRVAAHLREEYGCVGRRWSDLHHFLDKHTMLEAASAAGVAVPPYRLARRASEVAEFAARHGWALVVKPLEGRASAGVRRLDGPHDLAFLPDELKDPILVQKQVRHPVYHADGYFNGHTITPWRLARYVNMPGSVTHGPLAFNHGEPVGEVEVDDVALRDAVEAFLNTLVPEMSTAPWVFHCELFIDEHAIPPRCTFLEVGCRPGGGEIPFVWRELYGIDLMALEFALQLGSVPEAPCGHAPAPVGGSLLVPLHGPRPAQITDVTSMTARRDGPYAERVPAVGTVVPAVSGTYEHVGGRFRFRGSSTEEVSRQILNTARNYVVRSEPLAEARQARQRSRA